MQEFESTHNNISDLTFDNEKEILKKIEKLEFKCQRCSNCCRFQPGVVFLSVDDVKNISSYLNLDVSNFLLKYCRSIFRNGEQIVALLEKKNFDCIFWNNDGCMIYPVRPIQCKTYPFWPVLVESDENWNEEKKRCKGIGCKSNLTVEEKFELYKQEKNIVYMKII